MIRFHLGICEIRCEIRCDCCSYWNIIFLFFVDSGHSPEGRDGGKITRFISLLLFDPFSFLFLVADWSFDLEITESTCGHLRSIDRLRSANRYFRVPGGFPQLRVDLGVLFSSIFKDIWKYIQLHFSLLRLLLSRNVFCLLAVNRLFFFQRFNRLHPGDPRLFFEKMLIFQKFVFTRFLTLKGSKPL